MNNTQLKLPNLHNLSRNTPYKKKFLYTLYISKKKITETPVLLRRYLYEEMICLEDIELSVCWVTLVTEMFSYNLPPFLTDTYSGSESEIQSHSKLAM